MTIRCGFNQSTNSFQAGQTPPPWVQLVVANDAAVAVSVTGVELYVQDLNGAPLRAWAGNLPTVPIGFGQTVSVPAASSITIGPFAFTAPVGGTANQYQAVVPQALPSNPQVALPQSQAFFLRARVYASDGSITEAVPAQFFVSYANPPPAVFQGGYVQFGDQDNSPLIAAVL